MRFVITKVAEFYEIFDKAEMQTVFATTSYAVVKTALFQLNTTGKISNRLMGGSV